MLIKENYSKFFYFDQLNGEKKDLIFKKALTIRDFKNKISSLIHSDLIKYLELSKFDLIKLYSKGEVEDLTGKDKEWAIIEVLTTYKNVFSRIKTKLKFKLQNKMTVLYYKRNTKNKKNGDQKSITMSYCCYLKCV